MCVLHGQKLRDNRDGRRRRLVQSIRVLPKQKETASDALHPGLLDVGNKALAVGAVPEDELALLIADTVLASRSGSRAAWRLRARAQEALGDDRAAIEAHKRYLTLTRKDDTDTAARVRRLQERLKHTERTLRRLRHEHPGAADFAGRRDIELWADGLRCVAAGEQVAARSLFVAALGAMASGHRTDRQIRAALADFEDLAPEGPGTAPRAVGPSREQHERAGESERRIAFASYVDENYLPGFLALLRSLALNNPHLCEDFIVLYDDLQPASLTRIHSLHPRIVLRRVDAGHYDGFVKGNRENYLVRKAYFILDVFRIRDYDTVITLDTDMVVLGDISELLNIRDGLAAVPQYLKEQTKLNSGLLVISRDFLTDEFCTRIDEIGRSGLYELDKHDQGILNALLEHKFTPLDPAYNYVKRRIEPGDPVPEEVAVLHFTGRHKPWNGGERGYESPEAVWAKYEMTDAELTDAFLQQPGSRHPELERHFGMRQHRAGG
ncbi:glycosyltransferase family 8 protein [Streptomyces sp. MAR4 CNY-716]